MWTQGFWLLSAIDFLNKTSLKGYRSRNNIYLLQFYWNVLGKVDLFALIYTRSLLGNASPLPPPPPSSLIPKIGKRKYSIESQSATLSQKENRGKYNKTEAHAHDIHNNIYFFYRSGCECAQTGGEKERTCRDTNEQFSAPLCSVPHLAERQHNITSQIFAQTRQILSCGKLKMRALTTNPHPPGKRAATQCPTSRWNVLSFSLLLASDESLPTI